MQQSSTLQDLVVRAAQFLGSKTAVATKLGVKPNRLFEWTAGSRAVPDEKVIALAQLAGHDPQDALGKVKWEAHQMGNGRRKRAVRAASGSVLAVLLAWTLLWQPRPAYAVNCADNVYYVNL